MSVVQRAVSYRQDVMEENMKLNQALEVREGGDGREGTSSEGGTPLHHCCPAAPLIVLMLAHTLSGDKSHVVNASVRGARSRLLNF